MLSTLLLCFLTAAPVGAAPMRAPPTSAAGTSFTPPLRGHNRQFLDTADVRDWEEWLPTGMFHGVTTNPTLLERAQEPCTIENIQALAYKALNTPDFYCQEFMCQAWGETAQDLYECGMQLAEPDPDRIVVKVPVTMEGVKAATQLIRDGDIRVCLTGCYDSKQALIAAGIGAEYLAPYQGRMTDAGKNGVAQCIEMQHMAQLGLKSGLRILVASIRSVDDLVAMAAASPNAGGGLDTFTFSPQIARELFLEPLTREAALGFEDSARRNSGMGEGVQLDDRHARIGERPTYEDQMGGRSTTMGRRADDTRARGPADSSGFAGRGGSYDNYGRRSDGPSMTDSVSSNMGRDSMSSSTGRDTYSSSSMGRDSMSSNTGLGNGMGSPLNSGMSGSTGNDMRSSMERDSLSGRDSMGSNTGSSMNNGLGSGMGNVIGSSLNSGMGNDVRSSMERDSLSNNGSSSFQNPDSTLSSRGGDDRSSQSFINNSFGSVTPPRDADSTSTKNSNNIGFGAPHETSFGSRPSNGFGAPRETGYDAAARRNSDSGFGGGRGF